MPLVNDTSADMFSRPIDVARHALIYSGAQKNMGPAGLTVVIIRDDLLPRSQKNLPTMLNYAVHAENGSMYNTPPTFAIYALGLVMKWLLAQGGLPGNRRGQRAEGRKLYWKSTHRLLPRNGAPDCRSLMNVTFRLATEDLAETVHQGLHRGGAGRTERSPVCRRDAGFHLQRLSGRGRRLP